MKFGHNLYRNVVPEWQSSYLDYKALKKRIKKTVIDSQETKDADLAPFFFAVDRELEKVDGFYSKRLFETTRKWRLLNEKHGDAKSLDQDELVELVGVLLELRSQLRKISWYADINRRGFIKILKKLDKKTNADCQARYVNSKVFVRAFASSTEVSTTERSVNQWLEQLGDENVKALGSQEQPERSKTPLLVSSKAGVGLSDGVVNTLDISIRDDNSAILEEVLLDASLEDSKTQTLLVNLLQRAITSHATQCTDLLVDQIRSLEEQDEINGRNIIHRLVINVGRARQQRRGPDQSFNDALGKKSLYITPAETPFPTPLLSKSTEDKYGTLSIDDLSIRSFIYLLDHLKIHQRSALTATDTYGRLPLHYAAQYGVVILCKIILDYTSRWGQLDKPLGDSKWLDSESLGPLHLAIIGEHPKTLKFLLHYEQDEEDTLRGKGFESCLPFSPLLLLATKQNSTQIVQVLVTSGIDLNQQDELGESALHVAAKYDYKECARIILLGSENKKANLELKENSFGWTPLFVAAVQGHADFVDILIDAGADFERIDASGWTIQEHAALRGHLAIAGKIHAMASMSDTSSNASTTSQLEPSSVSSQSESPPFKSFMENHNSLNNKSSAKIPNSSSIDSEPVKSFGHRYLKNRTLIMITLGSKDIRTPVEPVELDQIPLAHAHSTQLDTALSLVVSATNVKGDKTIIDLPVQDMIATEPIVFETEDCSKVKLKFDLIHTYSGTHDKVIGRAVALLSSIKPGEGRSKVPLQGGITVPILAADTLEIIGNINFEFLVITPFAHPQMFVAKNQTYWKKLATPRVIGHRGLGKNTSRKSLQLGENTLQSFISAANLGASYVEFDVQLTKDHIPVLYHDFVVGETGIDVPVHSLTLEQFLHVNEHQNPKGLRPVSPALGGRDPEEKPQQRPRSMSLGNALKDDGQDMYEKMKFTRALKTKGFKGNTRGSSIQGPFQTLENVFKDLPPHLGFNIELKYPMLHQSEEHDMDTFGIEMNTWVDAVLKVVYDHVKERDLIFSSFNPDICLMLSFKQPSIPILFLTESGTELMYDIRSTSLKEAIRFASRWNLLGIVSASEPLVLCPRLGRIVKESGLVCVTYGVQNNDMQNVKLQVEQGVDAVIVDSVLAIRKGLTTS